MNFTPYAIQITSDGKCIYAHQFVQFEHNQHLLTGIISAMKSLYAEVFHEDLTTLTLQDYHIEIQEVAEIEIFLLYKGEQDQASILMTEILDVLCQKDMIRDLQEVVYSSVITDAFYDELDELFSTSFQLDLTEATIVM